MINMEIEYQITRLNNEYVQCIDEDRLEEWPGFFLENSKYIIFPRENYDAGLEGYWMYCENGAMMRDRIKALREVNVYNIHYDRHLLSNVVVQGEEDGIFDVRSNYAIVQTDVEGRCHMFSTGQYKDKVAKQDDGYKFIEKIVIVDSFNIDRPLAVPF